MTSAAQPPFEFNRIARNRLAYALAIAVLVGAAVPLVLGAGYALAFGVVRLGGSRTGSIAMQANVLALRILKDELKLAKAKDLPPEDDLNWLEVGLAKEQARWAEQRLPDERAELAERRAELERSRAADWSLLLKLLPATSAGLVALLALLYRGTRSRGITRLLARSGAIPAAADAGVTRLLDDLCARAHLTPPLLYIIESSLPYTLSGADDANQAVLAVTRGALDLLGERDLEVTLAHELSHIGNQDIRLDELLSSAALFVRLPWAALRRKRPAAPGTLSNADDDPDGAMEWWAWRFGIHNLLYYAVIALLLLPMAIYLVFVAPIAGYLIRAFVSHDREFMADFDAAWLTGSPEGLVSALAKIGAATAAADDGNVTFRHSCLAGASATGGWFGSSFGAARPSPVKRIERLVELFGAARFSGLEGAIQTGQRFAVSRESEGAHRPVPTGNDDLIALRKANPAGRVYRLLEGAEVTVYESQRPGALPAASIKPGELFVVFGDLGKMIPVNTAKETYGYIDRYTKMKAIPGVLPPQVYDPVARAAAEAALASGAAAPAPRLADSAPGALGLTREQLWIVVGFGLAAFAGLTVLLVLAAGK